MLLVANKEDAAVDKLIFHSDPEIRCALGGVVVVSYSGILCSVGHWRVDDDVPLGLISRVASVCCGELRYTERNFENIDKCNHSL